MVVCINQIFERKCSFHLQT